MAFGHPQSTIVHCFRVTSASHLAWVIKVYFDMLAVLSLLVFEVCTAPGQDPDTLFRCTDPNTRPR